MHRQTAAKIMALVAISGFSSYWLGIPNVALALNPNRSVLDAALGQLSRAESAQTPNEMINCLIRAKSQLPRVVLSDGGHLKKLILNPYKRSSMT